MRVLNDNGSGSYAYVLLLSNMLYIPFCSGVIAGVDFVAADHEEKKVPSVGKYVHTIYK